MPAIRELPLAASLLVLGRRAVLRRRRHERLAAVARRRPCCSSSLVLLRDARRARRLARARAARAPRRLARGDDRVVVRCPTRSWEYANRALVYALFAALGLWLAARTRELALGLMVLLGAVVVWSLLGKVLPPLYTTTGRVARLRGPVGLWNQLALLGDFALPLALWRKRPRGDAARLRLAGRARASPTRAAGSSRPCSSSRVARALGRADRERGDARRRRRCPPPSVVGIAFALPGVTSDGESIATRWRDGLIFGAARRRGRPRRRGRSRACPRPRDTPALRRALYGVGAVALAAVVVGGVFAAGSFTSSSPVESGCRPLHERGLELPLGVVAAGLARLASTTASPAPAPGRSTSRTCATAARTSTRRPSRTACRCSSCSETGVVGLALLARRRRRAPARRAGGGAATSSRSRCSCPRTSCTRSSTSTGTSSRSRRPLFVVAGALAGPCRHAARRRRSALLAAGGAALFAFGVLLLPWLGARWADRGARRVTRARGQARRTARTRSTRCSSSRSGRRRSPPRRSASRSARSSTTCRRVAPRSRRTRRPGCLPGEYAFSTALLPHARTRTSRSSRSSTRRHGRARGGDDYNAGAEAGRRRQQRC